MATHVHPYVFGHHFSCDNGYRTHVNEWYIDYCDGHEINKIVDYGMAIIAKLGFWRPMESDIDDIESVVFDNHYANYMGAHDWQCMISLVSHLVMSEPVGNFHVEIGLIRVDLLDSLDVMRRMMHDKSRLNNHNWHDAVHVFNCAIRDLCIAIFAMTNKRSI